MNSDPTARECSRAVSGPAASRRVALVTCRELPDLDPDDRLLLDPLRALGVEPVPVAWDAPDVDWSGFDLAVLRSPWDYTLRLDEFLAWTARVPRLANPADVVRWNTDKRYLRDLAAAGLPVVSTAWVADDGWWPPPGAEEYVIKPTVGAGSTSTGRYRAGDPEHDKLAAAHVDRLRAAGRQVMVQPYLSEVDTYGETALLYLPDADGRLTFSHAIRKGALLDGPDLGEPYLYKEETISPRVPVEAELGVGERVLAAIPGGADRLLYARVDLIPGPDLQPLLVELELTEPSLFLGTADAAPTHLAKAITRRLPS